MFNLANTTTLANTHNTPTSPPWYIYCTMAGQVRGKMGSTA
jgi:hypothetical protein